MACTVARVGGLLVEETLLPLVSRVGFWTSVGNPEVGLWEVIEIASGFYASADGQLASNPRDT